VVPRFETREAGMTIVAGVDFGTLSVRVKPPPAGGAATAKEDTDDKTKARDTRRATTGIKNKSPEKPLDYCVG